MSKKNTSQTIIVYLTIGSMLAMPMVSLATPLTFSSVPVGTGFSPPKPNVVFTFDNSGSMLADSNNCLTREMVDKYRGQYPNWAARYNSTLDAVYVLRNGVAGFYDVFYDACKYKLRSSDTFELANGNPSKFQTYDFVGGVFIARAGGNYRLVKPDMSRIDVLKQSLTAALNSRISDNSIRVGWQAMHNNGETIDASALTVGANNSIRPYTGIHKSRFLNYINSLTAYNGTPSHKMMKQVFDYMSTGQGINSPWAKNPGTTELPYLACRRAYHIFLTDGTWNSQSGFLPANNPDGTNNSDVGGSGVAYDPSANYARVFKGGGDGTLADWAFKSWATDLQSSASMPNNVSPTSDYTSAPATETIGTVAVPKFWNPKYDPATWQHLVTYSIGYGRAAYTWQDPPLFDTTWVSQPDNVLADTYGGEFTKLYDGTATWPTLDTAGDTETNRQSDLWHMALNSRGKFYPVDSGDRLTAAFEQIFQQINQANTPGSSNTASSGSNNVYFDLDSFTSVFESSNAWKGYVLAETLSSSGTTSPKSGWGTAPGATPARSLSTAEKLDGLPNTAIVNRVVLTTNDITNQGISFAWTSADATSPLSTNQKAYFTENGAVTDTVGENRVNFIRGDRSREDGITYRLRSSRQGDIVNSNIWYTGKPASNFSFSGYVAFAQAKKNRSPMIYVGGNDGMLHGFSASDGSEKIAYVPKGIMSRLPSLTKPGYTHQFFVDGSPFTGDVYSDDEWKTMLVGTLGAGGRGYFVLDVTDPTTFTVTDAATVVVLDNTLSQRATASAPADPSGTDADLGHIFSAPVPDAVYSMRASQIAKLNNGRWATVLGNGYNSVNEKPVLYIQYLDGTKEVQKINAIKAQSSADIDVNKSGNGLSAPRLVDINGDDQPDVVYAGDLKGNLWKFDISSSDSSEWDVAFSGSPLFVAYKRTNNNDNTATTANTSLRQPITVAPTVRPNERGRTGMMVAFGTGRNLTDADSSNTDVQSIYSVLDNTQYRVRSSSNPSRIEVHPGEDCSGNTSGCTPVAAPAVVTASDLLIQQSVSTTSMAGAGASSATTFWSSSSNAVDWKNNANIKGWYLNLPVSGERLLSNLSFYDGSNIMSVLTRVPGQNSSAQADEACSATYSTAQQYLSLLNIMDGLAPKIPLMDKNGDGYYSSLDSNASRLSLLGDGTSTTKTSDGFQVKSQGVNSANQVVSKTDNLAAIPILAIRPTWRQLQ